MLVFLQTKNVLSRPWCLVELYEALRSKVPIVTVFVTNAGYIYEETMPFLLNLEQELTRHNPGAVELLQGTFWDGPNAKCIPILLQC